MSHYLKIQDGCHITLVRPFCLLIAWLSFFLNSSMARTKVTPRKGEKDTLRQMRTRAEVHAQLQKLPIPADLQLQHKRPHWIRRWVGDSRGRVAGGGGEVARVITNLTIGPDGCGSLAIYIGQGGASLQEAPTYHGRQGPPEGILAGCTAEETPKVLTRDSSSSWDLLVPKEHRAPYVETTLLTASLQDSP